MTITQLRWKVILVDRVQYFRRPRSKKRRIRKKWLRRPENYRPLMVPVGIVYGMGSCMARGAPAENDPNWEPYWNAEEPSRPRIMEMHTAMWSRVKEEVPKFAERCDLFRRVSVMGRYMMWSEDVPVR